VWLASARQGSDLKPYYCQKKKKKKRKAYRTIRQQGSPERACVRGTRLLVLCSNISCGQHQSSGACSHHSCIPGRKRGRIGSKGGVPLSLEELSERSGPMVSACILLGTSYIVVFTAYHSIKIQGSDTRKVSVYRADNRSPPFSLSVPP
jgi:hypothetical protein